MSNESRRRSKRLSLQKLAQNVQENPGVTQPKKSKRLIEKENIVYSGTAKTPPVGRRGRGRSAVLSPSVSSLENECKVLVGDVKQIIKEEVGNYPEQEDSAATSDLSSPDDSRAQHQPTRWLTHSSSGTPGTYSDSDDEDLETPDALERKRLQNVQDNAAFLAQLKLNEAVESLKQVTIEHRPKPTARGLKPEKKEKVVLPRRKSLRLQRIDPDGNELPPLPPPEPEPTWLPRKKGRLLLGDVLINVDDEKDKEYFLNDMRQLKQETYPVASTAELSTKLNQYMTGVKKMDMQENQLSKVVQSRIFSMAIHPTERKVLVCAGDKWGKLGLWDVESTKGQDGVYVFEPHTRPVRHLAFHPQHQDQMFSLSYDGTVRSTNFEYGSFDEVFALSEDTDSWLYSFDFLSRDTLLISDSDGDVSLVDLRTSHTGPEKTYHLHTRRCRCVSVHPADNHYMATAAFDSGHTVCIWDVRHLPAKKPASVAVLPHGGQNVESAFFSPITGKYLLTTGTGNHDRLRIFDTATVAGNPELKYSIRHNNYTGRWLSNFSAVWHPQREDVFVIGSMERPRRIEMFSNEGKLLRNFRSEFLNSVCSLNVLHPTRNILAGGNSSGRVFVFM